MPITPEEFETLAPILKDWIANTLREHAGSTRTVASAGFKRLPLYYSPDLLNHAKFVPVARPPTPPLTAMGLAQFRDFEEMEPNGITYLDTYFLREEAVNSERLHFHELIHVVQWLTLGPERFLFLYADGLERFGYRDSPLEVMAYAAEERFANGLPPYSAEAFVKGELLRTLQLDELA